MRGGRLLTEKSPKALLDEYRTHSLEEVVLKLCHDDEKSSIGYSRARSKSSGNIVVKVAVEERYSHPLSIQGLGGISPLPEESFRECLRNSLTRIKSLTMKNTFVMLRNIL
jgi:hypothetical protein